MVAWILVLPAVTPGTDPPVLTVAIVVPCDAHAGALPVRTTPFASLATKRACDVCPTARLVESRMTDTEAVCPGSEGSVDEDPATVSTVAPATPSIVA